MDHRKNHLSFMVVSPSGKRCFNFQLPWWLVKLGLFSSIVGVIIIGIALYLTFNTNIKEANYKKMQQTTQQQQSELEVMENRLDEIQQGYRQLLEKEEELKTLLGDVKIRSHSFLRRKRQRDRKTRKKIKSYEGAYINCLNPEANPQEVINAKLGFLETVLKDASVVFNDLSERSYQYKARFASTPSIRPLYGRILSGYGWRRHPIFKRRKFHKGIDIASWTGAPIQATADGIVEYSGWSKSFGYIVVIDHDYGYRTLYAHCSQLLVEKRDLVKKGQVIAQVGTTGISSGPHLHYEVRKCAKQVSPAPYLDLDLFTATTQIW